MRYRERPARAARPRKVRRVVEALARVERGRVRVEAPLEATPALVSLVLEAVPPGARRRGGARTDVLVTRSEARGWTGLSVRVITAAERRSLRERLG